MDRAILGRSAWYVMHSLAHACLDGSADVHTFKRVCGGLLDNYPCEDCRINLRRKHGAWRARLDSLQDGRDCVLWAFFTHAVVNDDLDKPMCDVEDSAAASGCTAERFRLGGGEDPLFDPLIASLGAVYGAHCPDGEA